MKRKSAWIGLSLMTAVCAGASAQTSTSVNGSTTSGSDQIRTITTAVPFLRISPDARAGAMGDVGIATSADANAQYWNVAKLPFAEKKYGASVTATPWLKDLVPDIWLYYLSGFARFGENNNQAISASLRYFTLGDISFTNDLGDATGTGKPREYSVDLGYSRRLSDYLSVGLNLRYIHSGLATGLNSALPNVDYKPGNAFAADLGFFYTRTKELENSRSRTFNFGAVISNLGSKISYNSTRSDFIPINLGIGAAYTAKFDDYNKITFAVDLNKLLVPSPYTVQDSATGQPKLYYPNNKSVVSGIFGSFSDASGGFGEELREVQASAGLEYWYQNQFALRAGYFYEDKTKGDRKYFTAGLGVRFNVLTINAAYLVPSNSGINRNPLSNTLRLSLMVDLDKFEKGTSSASE